MSFADGAKLIYCLTLLWIVVCLWRGHRNGNIHLWELVTATDRHGKARTDSRKLYECGAFLLMSIAFAFLVVMDKLTEWFCLIYVSAWVVARVARDREQRLNRIVEPQKQQEGTS